MPRPIVGPRQEAAASNITNKQNDNSLIIRGEQKLGTQGVRSQGELVYHDQGQMLAVCGELGRHLLARLWVVYNSAEHCYTQTCLEFEKVVYVSFPTPLLCWPGTALGCQTLN